MKRYEQFAEQISSQIRTGVLRPGERIPSVRTASANGKLSAGTVLQAYRLLEDRGEIQTRPRSGYYVSAHWAGLGKNAAHTLKDAPQTSQPASVSTSVDVSELVFEILASVGNPDVVPFGSAFPSPLLFPLARLARALAASTRKLDRWSTVADLPSGDAELRRQIARRYLDAGFTVDPGEIVITNGALEALSLCLRAVTRPGDVVAIECPSFYGALQAIERMGLKAVEIPTCPSNGADLDGLAALLSRNDIKACWLMTNFQNPLGSLMPDDTKKGLVKLLADRGIPLIEDDVYGELYFGAQRPRPARAFDRDGLVMHCSSFSKCLAPGYRVGWALPGRHLQSVQRNKLMTSVSTSIPPQVAIADYLKHGGGYDRHLRALRKALLQQQGRMLQAIDAYFPAATRITRPQGGYVLWVDMPAGVDALKVHRLAMAEGISIAPGPMFSPTRGYANFMRLNYGHPWSEQMEAAMATLGRIVSTGQ
jgi:DNA-binding transcriptional MocR family regulator